MDNKFSFARAGLSRLPPGFRFQPTDEELVFQYLKCKLFSLPLPASVIPEINLCKYDPWDLPGDSEEAKYFFCSKEAKYPNGNRTNRTTSSGYWRATGSDKKIVSSRKIIDDHVVGMRKTLVFYRGKALHGSRTDWIMHEYRLVNAETTASSSPQIHNSTQSSLVQLDNWVLCRISAKKGSTTNNDEIIQTSTNNRVKNVGVAQAQPRFFHFMMDKTRNPGLVSLTSSSSSSSSSSSITEVSSSGADHEESSAHGGTNY